MATTWEVQSTTKNKVTTTTATYKVDGTTVATITGLKAGLTTNGTSISGITLDEAAGIIKLDSTVFGASNVSINSSKYGLGFDGHVDGKDGIVLDGDPTMSVSSGKVTVKANLKASYTLAANKKSITYTAPKTNAVLAEISGLSTSLVNGTDDNAGKVGINTTSGETTTFTEPITISGNTITLTQEALKDAKATLALKNGAAYTLALDGVTTPVTSNGEWTVNTSKGTATYTGDVTKGHTLSLDGKTVNFTAAQENKAIVTVTGVKKDADAATAISIENVSNDSHYGAKITLSEGALTTGAVTVGAGYQLALATGVSQDPAATEDVWAVNKTNAIYKQVTPAYYTYDATTNKITYTKQADLQTYATVAGLVNNLTVTEGSIEGIKLGTIDATTSEFDDSTPGKVIQLTENVLGTKKITVTGTGYTLTTDEVTAPVTSNEVWSRSGTTATLKGNITAGWTQTDDTTITYVDNGTNKVLATVKGLSKDLVVGTDEKTSASALGTNVTTTEEDGNGGTTPTTTFVPGLEKSDDNIIIANNVVGTTNITLTPAAGFNYALVLDDGNTNTIEDGGGKVATSATNRTFWVINGASLYLKDGKEAYFTAAADGKTINYTAPVPNNTLATVKGLKTDLKLNSNYEIEGGYVLVDGKTITVTEEALNAKDVTVTGKNGYSLYVDDSLNSTEENLWTVANKIAYYKTYDSEGYAVADRGEKIAYTAQKYKSDIAQISGLKNNIKVNADGEINGIKVTDNKIELAKSVLGTTDVALTSASDSNKYFLTLNDDVAKSNTTGLFISANNKGTAKYQATTTAGFVLDSNNQATKATYNKKSTVNLTLNGLANTISVLDGAIIGITADTTAKTFKLTDDVLDEKNVTLTGNGYTLVLDSDSVAAPVFTAGKWTTTTKKNVTTATLNGTVSTEGYQTSADGKTVNYFQETAEASSNTTGSADETESTAPESVVLATITGLNGNVTANSDGSIDGITLNNATQPTKFTLSKDVLGTSKVTVSGGNYTLALDGTVPISVKKDHTGWVTSGTTATLKKYDRGFYTLDDTKSALSYTADTKGTTYATIKGIKSGVDILSNLGDSIIGRITLSQSQLDGKKVTLTNSNGGNITLALASDVITKDKATATTGWVTSGTTATYKNYTPGYYKLSGGNTINYTAATKGSTIATIKGIKSGAEITSGSAKEVTLGADQLDGKSKKITITGDGYTLKLGDDVTKSAVVAEDTGWTATEVMKSGTVQSVNATYDQKTSAGYTLANSTTITYAATPTTATLAKITGLDASATSETIANGIELGTNSEGTKVLTLKDKRILGNTVKLTSSEYIFAMDGTNVTEPAEEAKQNPWTVNKNGTAQYKVTLTEGYVLAVNGKQLTKKAETDKTLLTLSGLNRTEVAKLFESATGNTIDVSSLNGIAVSTEDQTVTFSKEDYLTKKVTLGKKDEFSFVLDGVTEPEAYTNPKWTVSTVKGTTKAVLREGMEAGYELASENKAIVLTPEKAGDTVATLTGLVKGLKVSDDKQTLTFTNTDKTVSKVVTFDKSSGDINLLAKSLGTSDVTLESDDYSIVTMGGTAPVLGDKSWTFNNGTATYSQVQIAGYELAGDGKSVAYTAPKTTTFITVKGLEKTFSGDANSSLVTDNTNYVVTVKADILGTSKVTIAVPKNSTAYTLNLYSSNDDGNVAQQADLQTAQWVTNGTTAQYKDYNNAYYLVANGNKAINYYKPKDVKVYATVKGLASGADLSRALSGDTTGGIITLNSTMLGTSKVTLSGKGFALALDSDVKQEVQTEKESGWVTSGTTATYRKDNLPGYYTNNAAGNTITYTKGTDGVAVATITGVSGKLTASLNDTTFTVNGSQLGKKINVNGDVANSGNDGYAFNITNYSQGTINGSKNADNITTSDNNLSISTGDGDDTITVGGMYVTVTAGAGNDEINTSKGNNVFVFAKNQGTDTITGFKKTDELKTSGATATVAIDDDDIVVTLGTGTITLTEAASLGTIKINGVAVTPTDTSASNVLLADDNYSMDAANLSSIVKADLSSYTPYDFTSNFSLTKEDKLTPQISYSGNDK